MVWNKISNLPREKKIFLFLGSVIGVSALFVFSAGMVVATRRKSNQSLVKTVNALELNLNNESPYAAKKEIEEKNDIVSYIKLELCPLLDINVDDKSTISKYELIINDKKLTINFTINELKSNQIEITGFNNFENLNLKSDVFQAGVFELFLDNGINWSSKQINSNWIVKNKDILFENLPSNFQESNISNLFVNSNFQLKTISVSFKLNNSVAKKINITNFDLSKSKYVLKSSSFEASELFLAEKSANEAKSILNLVWIKENEKSLFEISPIWDNFIFTVINEPSTSSTLNLEIKNKNDSNDVQYISISGFAFDPNMIELITSSFEATNFSKMLASKKIEEARNDINTTWILNNKLKIFKNNQDFSLNENDITNLSTKIDINTQEISVAFTLMKKKQITFIITNFAFDNWDKVQLKRDNFSANEFLWIDATANEAKLLITNDWVSANSRLLFESNDGIIDVSKIKSTDFLSIDSEVIEKTIKVKLTTLDNRVYTFIINSFK